MRPDCPQTIDPADCLSDEEVAVYADGASSPRDRERIERVIDGCAVCRRQLSDVMKMRSTTPGASPGARRLGDLPARIGRFEIDSQLGAGGMGVVYRARDPELDREVAIKLLRADRTDGESHERLRREARAMARLNHPNVVTVHDVGEHAGQLFVAMELVDGETLAAWSESGRGDWRQTLARCLAAGRGLLAAHDAGLIHRDFKPQNVLCAVDGRVLVTDFGLARADRDPAGRPAPSSSSSSMKLTETGAVFGTPAYMAPEQFLGERVGEAADQFAFCVTVYECLYGRSPYAGASFAARGLEVAEGRVIAPPYDTKVPATLFDVLRRGLAVDPKDRFESMRGLLEALDAVGQPPSVTSPPARARSWVIGLGALAVVAASAAAASLLAGGDDSQRAAAPEQPVDADISVNPAPKSPSMTRFDVAAGLKTARKKARAIMSDSELTSIVSWGVRPDGTADVAGGAVITYSFRSRNKTNSNDLRADMCLVNVVVRSHGVTAYEGSNTDCAAIAIVGPPRCSFKEIWRRARAAGADSSKPARIEYTGTWSFSNRDKFYKKLADDC